MSPLVDLATSPLSPGNLPGFVTDTSVDATSPIDAASGARNKALGDFWTSKRFQLVDATGATDSTAGLYGFTEACRNAGRKAILAAGKYLVSGAVSNSANTNQLIMEGSDTGNAIIQQAPGVTVPLINSVGSFATQTAVTAGNSANGNTLTLASVAGISQFSVVLIRDTTLTIQGYVGGSAPGVVGCYGEYATVQSVAGNVVTFYGCLEQQYTTSADVRVVSGAISHHLESLTFQNLATPGSQSVLARMITLNYCIDVRLLNLSFVNCDSDMILLQWGTDALIDHPKFLNSHDLESSNNPYCVAIAKGMHNVSIQHPTSRYGRHLVTCLGGGTTEVSAAHVVCSDFMVTEHTAAAVDVHPGAFRCDFGPGKVHGGGPTAFGCQLRGPDCSATNLDISGVPVGYNLVYGANRARVMGGRVIGANTGVVVQDSDDCEVGGGILIDRPLTAGITTTVDAGWASFLTLNKLTVSACRITGSPTNPINNAGAMNIDPMGPIRLPAGTNVGYTPLSNGDPLVYPALTQALTVPSATATATVALLTSQTAHAVAIKLAAGLTFSNFVLFPHLGTASAQSNCWMALCNIQGGKLTVLAVSNDLGSTLPAGVTSNPAVIPVSGGSYTVPATGVYFLVINQNATIGTETWPCATVTSGLDLYVSGTMVRCGNIDSGQTTAPAIGHRFANSPAGGLNSVMLMGVG